MDKSNLRNMYITRRMTKKKIAEKLGCSEGKVKYFLDKYEIIKNEENIVLDPTPRTCPQCSEVKPGTDFYMNSWRGKKKPGSWCKVCAANRTASRHRGCKNNYVQLKGGCCQSCGFNKYNGALEFHHVDPSTKEETITKMMKRPSSPEILVELAKCVLVCSNCHKMIHAGIIECPKLKLLVPL